MPQETYTVVAETGSSSPDYQRWEERMSCGHHHQTREAALRCMARLTRWYCDHGHVGGTLCRRCTGGLADGAHTSADWYAARLHNQRGERVEL